MAGIVVIGGGVAGLGTALLLAGDGHVVTVLERDPAGPPGGAEAAWEGWERRGVSQFRLLHVFLPRFRAILDEELPAVAKAVDAAGALRFNPVASAPAEVSGDPREGDAYYELLTGRRPVVESAMAKVAEDSPGLTVRRGVKVAGLLAGAATTPGVPHVAGARTADGEEVAADLVVDATGRRSPLPAWLGELGAKAPLEEVEDSGFVYYARHYRSPAGAIPAMIGPPLQDYGTVSAMTLPADNGHWGVGLVASARDRALRGLRQTARWEAVVSSLPLVAHWLDGKPVEDGIVTMAKIEDRHRSLRVGDAPVATGVVAVADAWACTNPSLGRGASLGLMHGLALRDVLRAHSPDEPAELAEAFDRATAQTVEPWYRSSLQRDRARLAEIEAGICGEVYDPHQPEYDVAKALELAAMAHPECLRAYLDILTLRATPEEVLSRPGLLRLVLRHGSGWREASSLGPSRSQLVALATA